MTMPTAFSHVCRVAVLASVLAVVPAIAAQDDTPPDTASPAPLAQPTPEKHPGVLLGRRAGALLATRPVIRTVVIVPDPASYAEAVARWTPMAMFPVLIDDGSWAAQEDIARFVRGFQPESVVRWEAPDGTIKPGAPMRPAGRCPTPDNSPTRRCSGPGASRPTSQAT